MLRELLHVMYDNVALKLQKLNLYIVYSLHYLLHSGRGFLPVTMFRVSKIDDERHRFSLFPAVAFNNLRLTAEVHHLALHGLAGGQAGGHQGTELNRVVRREFEGVEIGAKYLDFKYRRLNKLEKKHTHIEH